MKIFRSIVAVLTACSLFVNAYSLDKKEWDDKVCDVYNFLIQQVWQDSNRKDLSSRILMHTHEVDNKIYCCVYEITDNSTQKKCVVKYTINKAHHDWRPIETYNMLNNIKVHNARFFPPRIIQPHGEEYTFVYMDKARGDDISTLDDKDKILSACAAWGRALRQLHDQGIIHNDMHSSNLLFTFAKNGEVFIDFIDLDDCEYVADIKERQKKLLNDLDKATDDIMNVIMYIKGHDTENALYKSKFEELQKKLFGSVKYTAQNDTEENLKGLSEVLPIFKALNEDYYLGFKMYEAFVDGYLSATDKTILNEANAGA